MGVLNGFRVLEFSEGWTGAALAGRLLAELGALVIKVEPPDGDPLRRSAPLSNGGSIAFDLVNAGKRSVVLDFRGSSEGVKQLRDMAASCDVVVDGLPFRALDELCLGETAIRALNPRVIWADISVFGRASALAALPAADISAQAMSGIMATTGFPDEPPTPAGFPLAEHASAAFGCTAILAALFHRDQGGDGQAIDIAAVDCLAYFLSSFLPPVFLGKSAPQRQGFRHPLMAPWDVFEAIDGTVVLCSGTDAHWVAILRHIGRDDLIHEQRFASAERRVAAVEEVNAVIQTWVGSRSAHSAIAELHSIGVPAGPILNLAQVFGHAHFQARQMLTRTADARSTLGSMFKMTRTPGRVEAAAPVLGADNLLVNDPVPAAGAMA